MKEEEKINQLLKKHRHFFETTTADVAQSIKGKHMFYLVDSRNGEYYSFKTFSTADELEKIILHEIADNMNTAIEVTIENLDKELNAHNVSYSCCENYGESINHLANSLDIIRKEYSKWRHIILSSLDDLMEYTERQRTETGDQKI